MGRLERKYERDTKSTIPDSVLIALLVSKTKGALLTHLRLNLAGLKSYQNLRDEILQYHKTVHVLNQGTSTSKSGPTAMEVDALINALQTEGPDGLVAALHGKGYFKRKGKGKGLGHFQGNFNQGYFDSSKAKEKERKVTSKELTKAKAKANQTTSKVAKEKEKVKLQKAAKAKV
jgi:hypothetical protein